MGELSMILTKKEVEDIKRRSDEPSHATHVACRKAETAFIPPYMRKWEENKRNNAPIIAQKVYQPL